MPAIINSDDGVLSGSSGLKTSGGNDGITAFQQNGTESVRITAAGNVGIGTTSPSTRLQVQMPTSGTGVNFRSTGGTNNPGLFFSTNESTTVSQIDASGSTSGILAFATSGVERARIDSSGRWTVSNQPGFMAGIAATTDATVNANSLVPFNTVTQTNAFNTGTHFNTSTNLFTAPVAGRYFFSFTLYLTNSASSTASMQGGIRVNGAFISFTSGDSYGVAIAIPNSTGGFISTTTSVILNLSANDTVGVAARTNSIRIYQGHCFFTGYLLG